MPDRPAPTTPRGSPVVLLLTDEDVGNLLSLDAAVATSEEAFRLLGTGAAENGVRQRVSRDAAVLNLMGAIAPTLGVMGVKTYPVVRTDVTQGSAFTFQLFDLSTGQLAALLRANVLGNIRTAAATAVATRQLARPDSRTLAVFGTGWVAHGQVLATTRVLPSLERVLVVGRSPERTATFCTEMALETGLEVAPSEPEVAIRAADVVITATGARTPVFDGTWLRAGTHVNAVGSNYADKQELDAEAVITADVVAVDSLDVARAECGDLLAGLSDWSGVVELGAVLVGNAAGRGVDNDITVFESQGLALLDLTAARYVVRRAGEERVGIGLETW
ncbi:ornithine cyclodeaminase family protein [Actinopolymorpha sp. B17G11]|uniref:ornithine cyclodeaminase family protein n=1 Tax=Actinopolymorpha sp. B17G11 TaxID=3160861 RepID=UPI0032E4BDDD